MDFEESINLIISEWERVHTTPFEKKGQIALVLLQYPCLLPMFEQVLVEDLCTLKHLVLSTVIFKFKPLVLNLISLKRIFLEIILHKLPSLSLLDSKIRILRVAILSNHG